MTETRYVARITAADNGSITTSEATSAVEAQRAINWTLKHRGGTATVTDRRNGTVRSFDHDGTTLRPS